MFGIGSAVNYEGESMTLLTNDNGVCRAAPGFAQVCLILPNINRPPPHVFAGPLSPGAESKDYSALRHFRNCNLTSESLQISTRRPQTPDEGIGTLGCKCCTQEVLKKVNRHFCTGGVIRLFSEAR